MTSVFPRHRAYCQTPVRKILQLVQNLTHHLNGREDIAERSLDLGKVTDRNVESEETNEIKKLTKMYHYQKLFRLRFLSGFGC